MKRLQFPHSLTTGKGKQGKTRTVGPQQALPSREAVRGSLGNKEGLGGRLMLLSTAHVPRDLA